jgi:ADP-ribose pyrophosphatase YjhB (NUDIX family)
MEIIHKIAAMVIQEDSFLMVRKKDKDTWTNLGGHPEEGETEEETLLREIREEASCNGRIIKKLGDFKAPAAQDDATVCLSTYLVELDGPINISNDPEHELADAKFFTRAEYQSNKYKFPLSITNHVIPFCVSQGLLKW